MEPSLKTACGLSKLSLYAHPGAIVQEEDTIYIKNNFSNTKMIDIGEGRHFIQEDNPHLIGSELAKWYTEL